MLHDARGGWFSEVYARVNHFLTVEVSSCRVTVRAIDADGQLLDQYELERC